jgi:hypothetical protein
MSFRSGPTVVLLVKNDKEETRVVKLIRPLFFDLIVSLASIGITKHKSFVKRDNIIFSINSDRDVEELGGTIGEEILYVVTDESFLSPKNTEPIIQNLCQYTIPKNNLNYGANTNNSNSCKTIVDELQKNGYFRFKFTNSEKAIINSVFNLMKQFTNQTQCEKEKYAYSSIGHMQPQFGYRSTNLQKEFFVCRKLSSNIKSQGICYPNEAFENAIANAIDLLGTIGSATIRLGSASF